MQRERERERERERMSNYHILLADIHVIVTMHACILCHFTSSVKYQKQAWQLNSLDDLYVLN